MTVRTLLLASLVALGCCGISFAAVPSYPTHAVWVDDVDGNPVLVRSWVGWDLQKENSLKPIPVSEPSRTTFDHDVLLSTEKEEAVSEKSPD